MSFQRGNALFLILIAVALFAALSYAVTQSGRGSGNVDRENANLQASQMLQMFSAWRGGIQRVTLINGCADTQLSMEAAGLSATYASGGPAQDECKVFHPSGGGQTYTKPSNDLNGARNIGFYSNFQIAGLGHGYSALIAVLPAVSKAFCQAYNARSDMGAAIPQYTQGAFSLTNPKTVSYPLNAGAYAWAANSTRCAECANHPSFCVEFTNTVTFANIETSAFPAGYYAFYDLWEK